MEQDHSSNSPRFSFHVCDCIVTNCYASQKTCNQGLKVKRRSAGYLTIYLSIVGSTRQKCLKY